jgi:hypothetical protein
MFDNVTRRLSLRFDNGRVPRFARSRGLLLPFVLFSKVSKNEQTNNELIYEKQRKRRNNLLK